MNRPAVWGRTRIPLMQFIRLAMVIALLLLIPSPSRSRLTTSVSLLELAEHSGAEPGSVIRTLPEAADVIGYRGPTEAMIVLDKNLSIEYVQLLDSADTGEHVEAVRRDASFLNQFRGWPWGGPADDRRIDGVSGATLTSLAMARGILKRIGGNRPSLVFPTPLSESEASLIRTGTYSDTIIGYQGPTELLLKTDANDRIEKVDLRSSFDNEPYVDYVRQERGFWRRFEGRSLDELAKLDPQAEGIEGVSGATMTSLAVADTLVASAAQYVQQRDEATHAPDGEDFASVRWTVSDIATISILAIASLLGKVGAFRSRLGRRFWLVTVVVVIGIWSGNLVSMALVAGWSAEGVAWRLAPGLATIAAVALLIPSVSKSNPYCNHLCPHGAIQQLIKPQQNSRRRIRLSSGVTKWLSRIPGLMLVIAYLSLLIMPAVDLAAWEPFHAYLFRIAGWGSIGLAAISLLIAAMIPMGYCRLGCPTGRLIDFVRLDAASVRFKRADAIAALLIVLAVVSQAISAKA